MDEQPRPTHDPQRPAPVDEDDSEGVRRWLDELDVVPPSVEIQLPAAAPGPARRRVRQEWEILRVLIGWVRHGGAGHPDDRWERRSRPVGWAERLAAVVAAPEDWYGRFVDDWDHHRRELAAAASPQYADTWAGLRDSNGALVGPAITDIDYMFDALVAGGFVPRSGWPERLRWWLSDHGVCRWAWAAIQRLQRGRQGWADSDVLSLNSYLATVVAGSLRHLAGTAVGFPGRRPWTRWEEWDRELRSLADALDATAEGRVDGDDVGALFARIGRAWPHLFD